jgi:hypothetical protein
MNICLLLICVVIFCTILLAGRRTELYLLPGRHKNFYDEVIIYLLIRDGHF